VAQRSRIIVVDGPDQSAKADLAQTLPERDLIHQSDLAGALEQSRDAGVQGVFLATDSPDCREQADRLVRAEHILDTLSDGVAVLDAALKVVWANPAFSRFTGGAVGGRPVVASQNGQ
jgi:PAS domain-containing protein